MGFAESLVKRLQVAIFSVGLAASPHSSKCFLRLNIVCLPEKYPIFWTS